MKKWEVLLPVAGHVAVEVEAENEEEAIEKALRSENITNEDIQEWDVFKKIIEGNVCHAPLWEAEATPIDDDE